MRRTVGSVRILVLWLVVALAVGVAPVAAQEAQPTPSGPPEGVVSTPLARHDLEALPPEPAYVGLSRLVYSPNSAGPVEANAGLTVYAVVSGTVLFGSIGPSAAVPASPVPQTGSGGQPAAPGEVPVAAGEQWVAPAGAPYTSRNAGAEPAEVLRMVVAPVAPPPPFSPGVRFERLAFGVALALPSERATLGLYRLTLVPGAGVPSRPGIGPSLVYVEAGTAQLTSPGVESMLAPGTSALVQLGTPVQVRAVGDAPLVLLVMTMAVDLPGAATPTPGTPSP